MDKALDLAKQVHKIREQLHHGISDRTKFVEVIEHVDQIICYLAFYHKEKDPGQ